MLEIIKSSISRNINNANGWKTKRKILIIESDDWGSIRTPDKNALLKLKSQGFQVDKCAYMLNDALESNDDMQYLFNFIESRPIKPVITANFLTANPDFEKIKESDFKHYYYERLDQTLSRYPNHNKVKELWLQGLSKKYFIPQLHGREHLNVNAWMKDLQNGNKETLSSFYLNMFGVSAHVTQIPRQSYQAAFGKDSGTYNEKDKILSEASVLFKNLFGFNSKTFIAPNYTWDNEVEKILNKLGVTHIQGSNTQLFYNNEKGKVITNRHYLGNTNAYSQKYLIRNVAFEPFSNPKKDWVNSAFKEIENAFFWNKPAILSTHRVNFVGSINPNNSNTNINLLNKLLDKVEQKWPNVEYMSSDQLAKIM